MYIYKIFSKDPEDKNIYIGSTTDFKRRIREHKSKCNNENSTSHNLFIYQYIRQNGSWNNFKAEIIHEFECIDNKQKRMVEQEYINKLNCGLNTDRSYVDTKLYEKEYREKNKEKHKEWLKKNKEKLKEKSKEYSTNNKEKIKEYMKEYNANNKDKKKEYCANNKDKIKEFQKEYRANNKDKIKESNDKNNKIKTTCECGSIFPKFNKKKHVQTKKHIKYIESI